MRCYSGKAEVGGNRYQALVRAYSAALFCSVHSSDTISIYGEGLLSLSEISIWQTPVPSETESIYHSHLVAVLVRVPVGDAVGVIEGVGVGVSVTVVPATTAAATMRIQLNRAICQQVSRCGRWLVFRNVFLSRQ